MDLRLVEYVTYLAVSVSVTVWAGRALHRYGAPYLADVLRNPELADSVNRLLAVGFYLVGLGGAALLLQVDVSIGTAADVVRAVATRLGLVLLLLGGLHLVNLAILHRLRRPPAAAPRPAAESRPLPMAGRWP